MLSPSDSWTVKFAYRLYGLLLWVLPTSFRQEYGASMLQIFLDRCRSNSKVGDLLSLVGIWAEAIFDVLKVAIAEHFSLLVQDIGYALRSYIQNPSFFIVALTALALGIGANSALYSVVNSVLLRPLPFEQPENLVNLWRVQPPVLGGPFSELTFLELQKQSRTFTQMIAFHPLSKNLLGSGKPERLRAAAITGDIFSLLGMKLSLGRPFLPGEHTGQGGRAVILSQGFWNQSFGSSLQVLGKTLRLDDQVYTIVGVAPKAQYPDGVDIWLPMAASPSNVKAGNYLSVMARLKEGVSLQQAQTQMSVIAKRLALQYPDTNAQMGVDVDLLLEDIVGNIRPTLFALLGATVGVLLIACINVANLLFSRGMSRGKEIAIRLALGASKARLLRQLLTETLLLFSLGGIASLIVAQIGINVLRLLNLDNLPRFEEISLNEQTLIFTAIVSLLTGLVFGIAPALQVLDPSPNSVLKEASSRATAGAGTNRVRNLLVVAQFALALVLLVSSGLLVRSFLALQDVPPGFDVRNSLTLKVALPTSAEFEKLGEHRVMMFVSRLTEQLKSLPGVIDVGAVNDLPLTGSDSWSDNFSILGGSYVDPAHKPYAAFRLVSSTYIRTMGIPLKQGRDLTTLDQSKLTTSVLINETLAHQYFSGQNAIGKFITLENDRTGTPREIVGVISDIKHYSLNRQPLAEIYFPLEQRLPIQTSSMTFVVRTQSDPIRLAVAATTAIETVENDAPILKVRTLEQIYFASVAPQRFNALLIGTLALLAVVLAAVGIYGVMSYTVVKRTREIGIRIALGAQPIDIFKLILGQGLTLACIGIGIGLIGAFLAVRTLATLVFGVSLTDMPTFILVTFLLLGVALLASYLPARKATKIDPVISLRYE